LKGHKITIALTLIHFVLSLGKLFGIIPLIYLGLDNFFIVAVNSGLTCLQYLVSFTFSSLLAYLASKQLFMSIFQFLLSVFTPVSTIGLAMASLSLMFIILLNDRRVSLSAMGLMLLVIFRKILFIMLRHMVPVGIMLLGGYVFLVRYLASLLSLYSRGILFIKFGVKKGLDTLKQLDFFSWTKFLVMSVFLLGFTAVAVLTPSFTGMFQVLWVLSNILSSIASICYDLLLAASEKKNIRVFWTDFIFRLMLFAGVGKLSFTLMPTVAAMSAIYLSQSLKEEIMLPGSKNDDGGHIGFDEKDFSKFIV
jgi:hypothetical protein